MKKFLTNLLIGLAAIQVKSEEERISLLLEEFYDTRCHVNQPLYPLSQNLVLNASRHHWNLHTLLPPSEEVPTTTCSTPLGIIGIFTQQSVEDHTEKSQCSTPLGIIGIFTYKDYVGPNTKPIVLNASRHHWNLH